MCAVWSVRVGQHPQAGAVPAQNLQAGPSPVGEHKQGPLARILPQPFGHQRVQSVEAFAQVARLDGDEYF
jgi:hypothetical protein